ncbi:MAG: Alkyl hydroperoxide reductase/Thiol specific antioxidant [Pseudonocardiales bacterium]|nr:Alkyl hydroperoxide reductase/Thiol specific antioxidant [Pseudonocardiales bacterium]
MRSSPPSRPRRRGRALAAALCVAALALLAGCTGGKDRVDQLSDTQYRYVSATPKGEVIAPADRKPAGTVTGTELDGSAFSMSDHAGDVVFINFWGSWCGPCVIETPELDKIYRANEARGVLFLGVAVKDVEDSTKAFVDNNDISYPIIFDFNAKAALQLGNIPMRGLPATVVLDKQGRVAAVFVGAILAGDIDPVLETLLAE